MALDAERERGRDRYSKLVHVKRILMRNSYLIVYQKTHVENFEVVLPGAISINGYWQSDVFRWRLDTAQKFIIL